jgi:hypothetical protein
MRALGIPFDKLSHTILEVHYVPHVSKGQVAGNTAPAIASQSYWPYLKEFIELRV